MSIIKRSKPKTVSSFRDPSLSFDHIDKNNSIEAPEHDDLIEKEAKNIQAGKGKGGRRKIEDRLDVLSRRITITCSPRHEALWRHCANMEERHLSEWIRRAVLFYTRHHH